MRYRGAAGLTGRRGVVAEFGARAWLFAARRRWALPSDDRTSMLDLSAHVLPREAHGLPEDVLLLMMDEVLLPRASADELFDRAGLTPQERKIARMLAYTAASRKDIAGRLPCTEGTLRTHVDRIYRKLGVASRQGLTNLVRK